MRRPAAVPLVGLVQLIDDRSAAVALAARRRPVLHRGMYLLSRCGDDGRIWFLATAVEAWRTRSARRAVHDLVWLGLESAVVNLVVKRIARRPRPDVVTLHEHRLRIPVDTSFPSGHASSSATMAVLLSERSPLAPLWAGLAVGIGASRVHVGVHHGSDVVAGWAVGVVFGLLGRVSRRRVLAASTASSGRSGSGAEDRRQ